MAVIRRLAALVLLAAAAGACATRGGRAGEGAGGPPVPGAVLVASIDVPDEVRPLVLTVYPTPRRAEYGRILFPLEGARFVDDRDPDFGDLVRAAGLELGWKDLPREGYVLDVSAHGGRTVVLRAARDDAGRRWSEQALAQLTHEQGGRRWVRECRVLDAPIFALRGNKRPQAWETGYRANFAWGAKDGADTRGRAMAAVYAPGVPLDASGAGVARALEYFRPWQDRGVRLFVVKFDDEGFALTPSSELRYGRFAPALVSYVKLVRQGLRRRDADARLYFLPQTYWWRDPRFEPYSVALRVAGGFDEDVGLVFTGPEVVSETIDGRGLAAARRAFGLTETKALLYDNLGREGDWGPLTGRDPAIALYADGVFGERGTPVHRLTRLDWLWNPEGYDPERSWRRAILELAGPRDYARLEAVCRAFRNGAPREDVAALLREFERSPESSWHGPVPRKDLVSLARSDSSRLAPPAPTAGAAAPSPAAR